MLYMWEVQEVTVFPQSCATIKTSFPWLNLETKNQNNLSTFQGETGVQGVPASKMKSILSYKKLLSKSIQSFNVNIALK